MIKLVAVKRMLCLLQDNCCWCSEQDHVCIDWVSLLKDMKGEGKQVEEKEHSQAADGVEGYIEVLINAGELMDPLKGRLKQILRKIEQKTV